MTDNPSPDRRSIELEVEVHGTPEEVWRAVATGPGIGSWYVPHEVEEREHGAATASFGPGSEMQVSGRVAAWEPPNRIVFDAGEDDDGLAFEWLVEAKDGGTCIVRLVNSGFLNGEEWDDYFDAMTEGWKMFMFNLQLHLEHFSGQSARASLPLGSWRGPASDAWQRLTTALGIDPRATVGDHIHTSGSGVPPLGGTVVAATPTRLSILVDSPAPGTAFLAAEGRGEHVEVSVWTYLYGDDGIAAAERDEPLWRQWLQQSD